MKPRVGSHLLEPYPLKIRTGLVDAARASGDTKSVIVGPIVRRVQFCVQGDRELCYQCYRWRGELVFSNVLSF